MVATSVRSCACVAGATGSAPTDGRSVPVDANRSGVVAELAPRRPHDIVGELADDLARMTVECRGQDRFDVESSGATLPVAVRE